MMRVEREELLKRYLEGGMNLEQEHEFFIQVALDKELRHELKAHQTIDRAFQKDRTVDPSRYAALQGNVAGMLAAMSPETTSLPEGVESVALRSSGSRFQKWMFGGLGGITLLLAIAAYLLIGPNSTETILQQKNSSTVPAPINEPIHVDRNSAEANGTMMLRNRDAQVAGEVTTGTTEPVSAPAAQRISPSSHVASTPKGLGSGNQDQSLQAASSNSANHTDTIATDVQSGGSSHGTTLKKDDSLTVKVNLLWKKK